VAAGLVAFATLTAFVQWERGIEHPMLPLRFFGDRRFTQGSIVVMLAFFVLFGFFFIATQYLQFVRGESPLEAGLALLPSPSAFVISAQRSAVLAGRYGAARVMAVGLIIVAAGFGMFAFIGADSPYLLVAAGLAVLGTGMSVTAAPATNEIMSAVPLSKA